MASDHRIDEHIRDLQNPAPKHWEGSTLPAEEKLGSRARLRTHFLVKASECYRAAALAQHPRARGGYKKTAEQWEAMAREAEAADVRDEESYWLRVFARSASSDLNPAKVVPVKRL